MLKTAVLFPFAGLLALSTLSLSPALARPRACHVVCKEPDSKAHHYCACWERAGTPMTTCGSWWNDECDPPVTKRPGKPEEDESSGTWGMCVLNDEADMCQQKSSQDY